MEEELKGGKGIYYQIRDGGYIPSKIISEHLRKTLEEMIKGIESYYKHEEDNEEDKTILPKG